MIPSPNELDYTATIPASRIVIRRADNSILLRGDVLALQINMERLTNKGERAMSECLGDIQQYLQSVIDTDAELDPKPDPISPGEAYSVALQIERSFSDFKKKLESTLKLQIGTGSTPGLSATAESTSSTTQSPVSEPPENSSNETPNPPSP